MPVPLFIKAPFQAHGRIDDRPTETVDILPSVADMIGIELPWAVDGRSVFGPPPDRALQVYRYPDHKRAVFTGLAEARERAVARQHQLFGSGPFFPGLFRLGPHPALLGKHLDKVASVGETSVQITIDRPESFTNVDLQSDFIPAHITGHVTPSTLGNRPVSLAVAVNGTIQTARFKQLPSLGAFRFKADMGSGQQLFQKPLFRLARMRLRSLWFPIPQGDPLWLAQPKCALAHRHEQRLGQGVDILGTIIDVGRHPDRAAALRHVHPAAAECGKNGRNPLGVRQPHAKQVG